MLLGILHDWIRLDLHRALEQASRPFDSVDVKGITVGASPLPGSIMNHIADCARSERRIVHRIEHTLVVHNFGRMLPSAIFVGSDACSRMSFMQSL